MKYTWSILEVFLELMFPQDERNIVHIIASGTSKMAYKYVKSGLIGHDKVVSKALHFHSVYWPNVLLPMKSIVKCDLPLQNIQCLSTKKQDRCRVSSLVFR